MSVGASLDLSGKTAVVTGGTRGIGRAIALRLAELGASVIATGTSPEPSEPLPESDLIQYRQLDLLRDDSTTAFCEFLEGSDVDVLVNNAGINRIDSFTEVKPEDWDDIVRVNLRGVFQLSQAAASAMRRGSGGSIINIASIFGVVTREQRSVYTTTKSGLIGMTKTMAVDLAADGILVNAVSPGFIETDLTRGVLGEAGMAEVAKTVPLGRLGQPDEIAEVVTFFASDLNTYMTGQNIVVDGGYVDV
jgi:3-oxoacyl-[acyl-carrier protein] reductase